MHDMSCRSKGPSGKMVTNRKDPMFRNWMETKLKAIKSEHQLNITLDDDAMISNYLDNIDPNSSS